MQHGDVDLCIVGCDRLTATGDAANKIGTYLKALAAKDNGVPFYVALPQSTIDWTLADGVREIPIEERDEREITHMSGSTPSGEILTVQVTAPGSKAANPAFDVTPARLITATYDGTWGYARFSRWTGAALSGKNFRSRRCLMREWFSNLKDAAKLAGRRIRGHLRRGVARSQIDLALQSSP